MSKLISEKQNHEAMRRQAILAQVDEIMKSTNCTLADAAIRIDVDGVSVWRWKKAYDAGGFDALVPKYHNCGRKPLVVLNEDELTAAKKLYVQTESKTTALRMLAHSDVCSDAVRAAILKPRKSKHTITGTLRDAISVSPATMEFYKSPKNTQLNYFFSPRDASYIDAAGNRRELMPGDLQESDDMTVNFGWCVPWPGGDKCADKFGCRLLRGQLLPVLDVRSCRFLSYSLIARLKDSYRMDDIWQFFGRSFADIGMPRIGMRLERGIWEGSKVNGLPLEPSAHTSLERRLGGLAALNIRVLRSYAPLTKIIENRFNLLQTWMATIPGQLGRTRGEMERQNKLWSACRDGRADPRDYFLSMEEVANRIESVMHAVNGEPVEGEIYRGVPDEVWAKGVSEQPLRLLPEDQGWLFARDRRVITVCKGMARVRLTGPAGPFSYWFHHESLYKYEGRQVAVYFDPYVEGGTAVITDAAGENPNEILCVAREAGRVPQFAMGDGYDDIAGYQRRRAFSNAVRTEYRALGIAGTRLARASELQDGRGNLASVRTSSRETIEIAAHERGVSSNLVSDTPGNFSAVDAASRPTDNRAEAPVILNGRDAGTPRNNRATEHLVARPGVAAPFVTDDFDSRVKDADAFEEKLRATGAIT